MMWRNSEPARGVRRVAGAMLSMGAVVVTALTPKCPLCVVAVLSAAGIGGAGARYAAPLVQPLTLALALVVALSLVWAERRRARRRASPCCRKPAISWEARPRTLEGVSGNEHRTAVVRANRWLSTF
jgi:adenine-specific DNA glycosylase